jgi:hypothetical protein
VTYADLYDTTRLIVCMIPSGAPLTAMMTNQWMKGSWAAFEPDQLVVSTYQDAAAALRLAVQMDLRMSGLANGVGARRLIEDYERGVNRRLDFRDNAFLGDRPAFLAPEFCVEDLRRIAPLCLDALAERRAQNFIGPLLAAEPQITGPDLKAILAEAVAKDRNLSQAAAFKIARDADCPETREIIIEGSNPSEAQTKRDRKGLGKIAPRRRRNSAQMHISTASD